MKPIKTFHLICEPMLSFGRIVAILGVVGILIGFFFADYPSILNGKIYKYDLQTRAIEIFGYAFFIFLIIVGLIGHRVQKWDEYKIELYPDNWMRHILIHPDGDEEFAYVLPDLVSGVSKYKKRYSRRKKNWYIWLDFEFYYDGKLYAANFDGWVVEPKDVRKFDDFANLLRKLAQENRKKIKGKIPPRILAYGMRTWANSEYGQKVFEERERLMKEDEINEWSD